MENAEALRICLDGSSGRLKLERGAFASTPNLRFLELNGANLAGDFNHLFQELRWFSWHSCPSDQEVLNLRMKNLVILDLSRSDITEHWIGWTEMKVHFVDHFISDRYRP